MAQSAVVAFRCGARTGPNTAMSDTQARVCLVGENGFVGDRLAASAAGLFRLGGLSQRAAASTVIVQTGNETVVSLPGTWTSWIPVANFARQQPSRTLLSHPLRRVETSTPSSRSAPGDSLLVGWWVSRVVEVATPHKHRRGCRWQPVHR